MAKLTERLIELLEFELQNCNYNNIAKIHDLLHKMITNQMFNPEMPEEK